MRRNPSIVLRLTHLGGAQTRAGELVFTQGDQVPLGGFEFYNPKLGTLGLYNRQRGSELLFTPHHRRWERVSMGVLSVKYPRVPSGLPRTREVLHQIKDRYVLSSADADTESRPDHGQANLVCWNGGQGNVREPVAKSVRFGLEQISQFPIPSATRLRALFDLTHAEAKLAQHLSRGDSLEEVAEKLSIKMTTARTQLAAVFAKTETRRQAKLVAVLSRVAHLE